jgi:hypothetical protein
LQGKLPDYRSLLLGVLQEAYKFGEKLCRGSELFVSGTLNPRIMGDIVREVNAYKILNQNASNEEVQIWAKERLPHFFDFVADPLIVPSITLAKQTPEKLV